MGEVVAGLAQLVDERALHPPERETEDIAPPLVHDREQTLCIPGDAAVRRLASATSGAATTHAAELAGARIVEIGQRAVA